MNLTYEIVDNGYYLLKDGERWIYQPSNIIPYPGKTLEESAQNHIDYYLHELEEYIPPEVSLEQEIADLKASQTSQDELIMSLMLGGVE